MKPQTKNVVLVIVLIAIAGIIWYVEAGKPERVDLGSQDIVLNDTGTTTPSGAGNTTSTATSTSSTSQTSSQAKPQNRTAIRNQKATEYPRAKELEAIQGYINTPQFKLADLVGKKVILVDFWTYSCINCLRTIPYLNAWYDKYKDSGLVIIGVHTPEFDFEKDLGNVSKAVQSLGIQYPVVLDSLYGTWNAYGNRFWPHEYLIDIDGFIVHDKIGEGDYDGTEEAIQAALKERNTALGLTTPIPTGIVAPKDAVTMDSSGVQSPETYFGSDRNEYLGNGNKGVAGAQTFTLPQTTAPNMLYLGGPWNISPEYAETTGATKIIFNYSAKNVYFVASAGKDAPDGVKVTVLRDGKPVSPGNGAGADVGSDSTAIIKDNRLYSLIQGTDYGIHTIEIDIQGAGLDAYTFTFG